MSLDPQHEKKRRILRVLGLILMASGGILFVFSTQNDAASKFCITAARTCHKGD